jgi:hypothetical protein
MKGDLSNMMSLPSPLGKPFFFLEHPSKWWRVGFFITHMGVARFPRKWQGRAYMGSRSYSKWWPIFIYLCLLTELGRSHFWRNYLMSGGGSVHWNKFTYLELKKELAHSALYTGHSPKHTPNGSSLSASPGRPSLPPMPETQKSASEAHD